MPRTCPFTSIPSKPYDEKWSVLRPASSTLKGAKKSKVNKTLSVSSQGLSTIF